MMRITELFPLRLLALFSVVFALTACELEVCTDVVCNNGGVCVDGYCECPLGYEGESCNIENTFFFNTTNTSHSLYPSQSFVSNFNIGTNDDGLPPVSFSLENVPDGFTATLSIAENGLGGLIEVESSLEVEVGEYAFDLVAETAGGQRQSITKSINILPSDYEVSLEFTDLIIGQGTDKSVFLFLDVTEGVFLETTFSAFNAPPNTTVTFEPQVLGEFQSSIIFTINTNANPGTYTMAVDAINSAGTTKRVLFQLMVV